MMKYIAFALLFILGFVFPFSSNDAVNMVVNANYYLYDGETYTPPNVPIEYNESAYWVVPITSGNNIVTYFPIEDKSGELSSSRGANRGLFDTAEKLRELQFLKNSISSNPGVDWIFSQKYQTIFNEMSSQIEGEVFQLNTVETTLDSEGVSVNVSSLKNELKILAQDALDISEKIADASNKESKFVNSPSPDLFSELNFSFNEVFSMILEMNDKSIEYQSNVDKLKLLISNEDIEAQTKAQLFSILESPAGLKSLRNYNLDAIQIQESFDSVLKAVSLRQDSILDELDKRVAKDKVHKLLYDENDAIKEETNFTTLSELHSYILSEQNISLWESQSKVNSFEQNYSRAVNFYEKRDFEKAENYANESISDALGVIRKGMKEIDNTPVFDQNLLFMVAGLLTVILILLYLFNNRGKLNEALAPAPEEVDIYD